MGLWEIISSIIGGGITGGPLVLLCLTRLRQCDRQMADLESAINGIKNVTIPELNRRVEVHLTADKSQEILTKLEFVIGQNTQIGQKVDRLAEETASQAAEIGANARYVNNLDASFQRHQHDRDLHQHRGDRG